MTFPERRPSRQALRRAFRLFAGLIPALAVLLALPASVSGEVGIRVTPTHLTLTVPIGDRTRETIQLQNMSPGPVTISALGSQKGSPDSPDIQLDPRELKLQPGQSGAVSVNIALSPDTEPGRKHQVVKIEAQPEENHELSIIGQVDVAIDIDAIQPVSDPSWSYPLLVDSSDSAVFGMEAQNTGSFPTRMSGTVDIHGLLFGDARLQGESKQVAVGNRSQLSAIWDDPPLIGIKRVTLLLGTGAGTPLEKHLLIFIFPWKLLLAVAFVGIACLAGLRLTPSRRAF